MQVNLGAQSAGSSQAASGPTGASRAALTIAALGVVYGDIGTSPLYALKESFNPVHGVVLNTASVLGILSLIVWTLTLVVTLKYIVLVLRAEYAGEGGILALQALARRALANDSKGGKGGKAPPMQRALMGGVLFVGLLGATMFYGDAFITPAISVLSAIEGIEVATPPSNRMLYPSP